MFWKFGKYAIFKIAHLYIHVSGRHTVQGSLSPNSQTTEKNQ